MRYFRFAALPALSCLLFSLTALRAQDYKTIVVFGDSLSDTGNDAHVTVNTYGFAFPQAYLFDYTMGRFTDGTDTTPAANKYRGVWAEQLAAMLPTSPLIANSLDGGNNYAYGAAFTGAGTTYFNFYGPYTITIENVGQQIKDYLATNPKIDDKTLFIVWAGANDVLNATTVSQITDAAVNQAANVERLVEAGATQFIVPDLPPLGKIPRLVGGPYETVVTAESMLFNDTLAAGLKIVHNGNPNAHLRIYPVDVFALFNTIIASPAAYGLVNVTGSAQGLAAVNPDTYLFWDGLHPTTRGHNLVAGVAADSIQHHACLAEPKGPKGWGNDGFGDGNGVEWKCTLTGDSWDQWDQLK